MRWYLTMVSVLFPGWLVMVNFFFHILVGHLCILYWEMIFQVLRPYKKPDYLISCCCITVLSFLYFLDNNPLPVTQFANTSSHLVIYPSFCSVSFAVEMPFCRWNPISQFLPLNCLHFGNHSKANNTTNFLHQSQHAFLLFPSSSFTVWSLKLKPLIYSEVTYLFDEWWGRGSLLSSLFRSPLTPLPELCPFSNIKVLAAFVKK